MIPQNSAESSRNDSDFQPVPSALEETGQDSPLAFESEQEQYCEIASRGKVDFNCTCPSCLLEYYKSI